MRTWTSVTLTIIVIATVNCSDPVSQMSTAAMVMLITNMTIDARWGKGFK